MNLLPSLTDLRFKIIHLEPNDNVIRIFDRQTKEYIDMNTTEANNFLNNTASNSVVSVNEKEVNISNSAGYTYSVSILRKVLTPVSLRTV